MTGTDVVGTVAREVALLAELAPTAALAAASTAARRYLGLAGLTEGRPADLVTYHDDPRDDPTLLAQPSGRRGQWLPHSLITVERCSRPSAVAPASHRYVTATTALLLFPVCSHHAASVMLRGRAGARCHSYGR